MDDEYQWQAVAAIIGVFILITSVIVVVIWTRTTTTRALDGVERILKETE
ncbi:hypothetical protein [Streptomyces sp. DSM 118878]